MAMERNSLPRQRICGDKHRRGARGGMLLGVVLCVCCLYACAPLAGDTAEANEPAEPVVLESAEVIAVEEEQVVEQPTASPAAREMPAGLPVTEGAPATQTDVQDLAAVIFVDNLPVVALPSKQAAEEALDELKAQYGEAKLGGQLKSVEFAETVDVLEQSDAVMLHDALDAMLKLATGGKDGGAFLHVKTVETVKVTEALACKTETVNDATMNAGTSKTLQSGKDGKAESVYDVVLYNGVEKSRKLIKQQVLEKPVNKIVAKGTKATSTGKPGPNEGDPGPSAGSLSFSYPISGRISSYFGMRYGRMHYGLDIPAKEGTQIKASESGKVSIAETRGDYGLLVEITHTGGFVTRYAHCSKLLVAKGQQVSKGDVIALVGNTGNSSAPHVHFEIRASGVAYNALQYLK